MNKITLQNSLYIVYDNFEKAEINFKFINSFIQIKKILNINLCSIFIGINIYQNSSDELNQESLPWVNLSAPKQNFQADILKRDLRDKIAKLNDTLTQKIFDQISEYYINDLVGNVGNIVFDLSVLIYLSS